VRHQHGKGVVQDCVEAYKWMSLAASRAAGDDPTPYARRRDALARRMTPQQLQEAEKRAGEWAEAFERRASV
jgi:TPR repeat protein